jgi:hypothetical protein
MGNYDLIVITAVASLDFGLKVRARWGTSSKHWPCFQTESGVFLSAGNWLSKEFCDIDESALIVINFEPTRGSRLAPAGNERRLICICIS